MIFFDLDGTLLESNGLWIQIDIDFLRERGIETIPPEYFDFVSNHVAPKSAAFTKELFQLSESAEEIMQEWQNMARYAYCHELPLTKGAKNLLEELRENEVSMCLLTACIPELCYGALEHHAISAYFKTVHTAIELGFDKRDKELFPLVAQLQGKHPSECILIDDAIDYCMAAKAAGFTVIGVHDPATKQDQTTLQRHCDLYIEDLTQLSAEMLIEKSRELEEKHRGTI